MGFVTTVSSSCFGSYFRCHITLPVPDACVLFFFIEPVVVCRSSLGAQGESRSRALSVCKNQFEVDRSRGLNEASIQW